MDSIWVPTEDQECDNVPDIKEDYKDEGSLPTKPAKVLGAESAYAVIQHGRSCSPVPSCLSMKSDCSMELPLTLKQADNTLQQRGFEQTTSSNPPSCLSIRSHQSMDPPFKFKDGAPAEQIRMQDSPYSPSCLSMKSNCSMELPVTLKQADNTLQQRGFEQTTSSYPPGCLSIRSHQSMDPPFKFKDGATSEQLVKDSSYGPSCLLMKSEHSMDPSASFKEEIFVHERQSDQSEKLYPSATLRSFEERFMSLMKREMKKISQILSPGYGASVEISEDQDSNDVREASLKIAHHILRDMKEKDLVEKLKKFEHVHMLQKKLQFSLKHKSQHVFEGIAKQGNPALLNKIYTELYITEGGCGTPNDEHEVRQIESLNRVPTAQETAIRCKEIFKPLPGQDKCIRTVLTNGVAGIGKTVSVQKFILDWAEGKANQDVHFLFPLPFRELNLMREEKQTLEGLLHCFFKDIKNFPLSELQNYKVIFIFDGLDECRFPLDFRNYERCSDITKPASLEIILTNLIAGNLLPCSLIWITSRPAAANQLPAHYIDQVTEVRGFNDLQKEEYFHKRISDPSLANKIIHHVKSFRSLHIMCHIPVFCWISATVLERRLSESDHHHMPKSLTEMYTHFLIFQTVQRHEKYARGKDLQPCLTKKNLLSLGKLAFQQLSKGDLIFYEEDLQECGIDIKEASVYSGVCTQIFKEEFALFQKKFYSFVHLSFQEYLAALFVHLCWTGITESDQVQDHNLQKLCLDSTIFDLHKSALDLALKSKQGHFDLFLRFLLGLSLESNQEMLCNLLQKKVSTDTCQETVTYIKFMLGEYIRPESAINLFYCLQELNDHSLVQEIQTYLNTKSLSAEELSPALWSALVFVLLTNENLEVFDLRKYIKSDEGYKRLKPVAKASRTVIFSSCNLTKNICHSLASILMLKACAIRELDLSYNPLQDKGVAQLSRGLLNSNCRLKVLKLAFCGLTKTGWSHIASALRSNPGHLRELDLSYNLIGSEALTELVALPPDSRIETLRLVHCNIKKEWCAFLASAANTTSFHLKHLDLSENTIGDLGARVFPELLSNTNCKLQSLRLSSCEFTERGFFDIASGLKSNNTCLRYLDLSKNFPGKAAMEKLCAAIRQPSCTLQTLCLDRCDLDSEICPSLVKTLQNSSLRELSLSHNNLGDVGVRTIFTGLKNRRCTLKILRLANCSLTDSICDFLAPALSPNTVGLSELDLSSNNLSQDRASFLCSISYINFIL
ncbi:NACHT, LRR and PYD domains-containing protein 3-like isoform X1 [Tachysurus fulvidraco]|uniref:NACHT, LRR and PYD domains-containing protein 3-like isoform X1 n=2 Tax=Tachysurus fulvidraco TaxID=1234273 RepID=UPI001FEE280C|nr:NACHT, LRR and PYD domains-containing protein 3-like isoform X1 [Tachysurus fulvidraco]